MPRKPFGPEKKLALQNRRLALASGNVVDIKKAIGHLMEVDEEIGQVTRAESGEKDNSIVEADFRETLREQSEARLPNQQGLIKQERK